MGFFSKGLKNDFETAMVNKPAVFEPLKFYCMWWLEQEYKFVFFFMLYIYTRYLYLQHSFNYKRGHFFSPKQFKTCK